MGASFYGYIPTGQPVSMAYSAVERYREYLIKMRDNRVFADERVLWGIKAFVRHPDCEGDFSTEDCEYISIALKELLTSNIIENPTDAAKLIDLYVLFKQMSAMDGIVMIY
jgi:hypothetical protein